MVHSFHLNAVTLQKQYFELEFLSGAILYCDLEHLILIAMLTGKNGFRFKARQWSLAQQMQVKLDLHLTDSTATNES